MNIEIQRTKNSDSLISKYFSTNKQINCRNTTLGSTIHFKHTKESFSL